MSPRQLKKWRRSNRRGLTRVIAAEGRLTSYSILGWNHFINPVSAFRLSFCFCYVDNDTVLYVMSCQNLSNQITWTYVLKP